MFGCSRIIIVKRKKKAQGDRGMKARADQEAKWYMRQRNEKRMRLTSASQGTERSNASLGGRSNTWRRSHAGLDLLHLVPPAPHLLLHVVRLLSLDNHRRCSRRNHNHPFRPFSLMKKKKKTDGARICGGGVCTLRG
jgi:hypothetical protein